MLVLAVCLLAVAMVVVAVALRRVVRSPSPRLLAARLGPVRAVSADLDDAVDEFRGRVAERGAR
ncbi:MAG: hypothetical protein ACKO04_02090 [Actinomycetes bacterium]